MTAPPSRLSTALADRYRIERELGHGGMATVFLAHDVKHNRNVALKVLRPELAAVIGADRFLKEIEVTANLQHPNILPLYDSGQADSFLFYVMPFVEGESLRDKIVREKQLAVEEAVAVIRAVAGALDYAHRHGIIHRDIKPENILLLDGNPVVADFGIALAVSHAGGSRLTETGLSVGTPHYMSPEQAMGDRELDARSDVYSLGAMLYELLVGEPPFTGPTAQAIVAKVITEKAPLVTVARDTVPRPIAMAVYKALAKLPADRYPSASAFSEALVRPLTAATDDYPLPATGTLAAPALRRLPVIGLSAAVVLFAALAAWGWLRPAPPPPGEPARFALDIPESARIPRGAGTITSSVIISPDGGTIVYVGRGDPETRLYRRPLDQLASEPLRGTDGADAPFFSPDGRWVGFRQGNRLRKVDLRTGAVVPLADLDRSSLITGATWSAKDTVYVGLEAIGGLFKVGAGGGKLVPIRMNDTTSLVWWPSLLPGGRWILVSLTPADRGIISVIAAVSLETGEVRRLVDGAAFGQYLPDGRMLFVLPDGTVMTAPLDPADPRPTTERVPVGETIARNSVGGAHVSVAGNGTAVFLTGGGAENTVVLVDRAGRETPLLKEPRDYKDPRFSPDGRRLAYELVSGNEGDIWIYEFDRATSTRVTFSSENLYPVWTPDGKRVVFASRRAGIAALWWTATDGSGEAERLLEGSELRFPGAVTPDGSTLLYRETASTTGFDLYALPLVAPRTPRPVLVTPFNEVSPMISPDGRYLAYVSDRSGRNEVYVRAFPAGATDWQISAGGGSEAVWEPAGGRLYYRQAGKLIQATLQLGDRVTVVRRDSLFSGPYLDNVRWPEYDVRPDGKGFVFIRIGESAQRPVIVLNWTEALRRRAQGPEGK